MLDLNKIAKAAAIITFDSKDAKFYIDKCDMFDLDPHWLGKVFVNTKTSLEVELSGMRKVRGCFFFIVKDNKAKNYLLISASEFIKNFQKAA